MRDQVVAPIGRNNTTAKEMRVVGVGQLVQYKGCFKPRCRSKLEFGDDHIAECLKCGVVQTEETAVDCGVATLSEL